MIKVREFHDTKNIELESYINEFLEKNEGEIELIDIKYNTFLDTYHNNIMSYALVIYKEKGDE